jgi:feruloyl esterase
MTHCSGGVSTDKFDALTVMQSWVEKQVAPDRIVATGTALPGQSRPLCPYPRYASYEGGNRARAQSFNCVLPAGTSPRRAPSAGTSIAGT